MINGVHHMAISTADFDRSVAFYRDLLGFELCMDSEWEVGNEEIDRIVGLDDSAARFGMLKLGNAYLELFEYRSPVPKGAIEGRRPCDHGITHICLDITDADAEYERLRAAGVQFTGPPQSSSFGVRTMYGKDPDGNLIELQEIYEDSPIPALGA